MKVTFRANKANYNKIISGQPCEDVSEDDCNARYCNVNCSKLSMRCSEDLIADICKKTCGKCKDTNTRTLTTNETVDVEDTSSTETPTTAAGIFFIF